MKDEPWYIFLGKLFVCWVMGMACLLAFTGIIAVSVTYWEQIKFFANGVFVLLVAPLVIGGVVIGYRLFPKKE